jgi:hypothetical protein
MDRPVLSIQTVYFDETGQAEAQRLGSELYHHLTRPAKDPLGYGAGIPVQVAVRSDRVELGAADRLVLIPVLVKETFHSGRARTMKTIESWHAKLAKTGLVLPLPLATLWRNVENDLPGKPMLTELYGEGDRRGRTIDEIVLAVSRLLDPSGDSPQLFVSHAKADLAATEDAAKKIHDYVATDSTGSAFFDKVKLKAGKPLADQLKENTSRGVMVVVRSDAYSSRDWCQKELLQAKKCGLPTLTVELLKKGELRSSPYAGNGPSMVWDGDPVKVASRAMGEWLRRAFFTLEANRVKTAAGLPVDTPIVARPPELLDLAQGPLANSGQLVIHPDPELPVVERAILNLARPRLQLVTPTTAFRRLLGRRDSQTVDASSPLEGMLVSMSLSETPDADGPDGYTANHVIDATVYIARSLISAGAAIAYGGDFRQHKVNYTELLAQLILTYNQTASRTAAFLHTFLAATTKRENAPDLPLEFYPGEESPKPILPPPSDTEKHAEALYTSDMRRIMELQTTARIVLGGKAQPRTEKQPDGFGGRYPGILEEAWRCLQLGHPLYVVGGFGGAGALVADLFDKKKEIPEALEDETWMGSAMFKSKAAEIDEDPYWLQLGLPRTIQDLAREFRKLALPLLKDDATSQAWNGLSVKENRLLFESRDPVILASLVSKGLFAFARTEAAGKLQVELVHGSLTTARNLDVIAIATMPNVPLAGAGAALDRAIGGRASAERDSRTPVRLTEGGIDCDWLFMASLGGIDEDASLEARVEQAAQETAKQAKRHGFQRIGVVTFGGSLSPTIKPVAEAMIRGFQSLPRHATIVWFETDENRFNEIQAILEGEPKIAVTTQRAAIVPLPGPRDPLIIDVRFENGQISATTLLPSGTAVASMHRETLSPAEVSKFSEGIGASKRITPDLTTLKARGPELAKKLLGDNAAKLLDRYRDSNVVVVHDIPSSKLPFEMLATVKPAITPALEKGITRRLVAEGLTFESQTVRPPKKGKLRLLLIVNPTGDLSGAAKEAAEVRKILEPQKEWIELTVLEGKEATDKAVRKALASADVLHYCGHAFFDGPEANQSGLILAGNQGFTVADLGKVSTLPRMAFVNACEAGRVRGKVTTRGAAFAELFLRSGVEAYVGTYWEVGDHAASLFASQVYLELAAGKTLESAVLVARKALIKAKEPDWANYILFGGGNFRLVTV